MSTTPLKRSQNATTIRFDDDYTRTVIDKAASLVNQTRTGFMLLVAREKAEEIIKERLEMRQHIESLILSADASLDVAETLLESPKPNKAMTKAMKDFKKSKIANKG